MQDKNVYGALDAKFNSDPTPVAAAVPETPAVKAAPVSLPEVLIDDDFDQARQALKDMIKKGQTAVDDIMGIARQSDHPRAFEVTGQLIKTVAETAKDLLALQKQKKDLVTEVVISAGQYTQKQGDKVVELDNCMSLMLCGRL